jgi:hypothetical protein
MPKKLTTGERIARRVVRDFRMTIDELAALIDAAVRKAEITAAWEGWDMARLEHSYDEEGNVGGMEDVVEDFEAEYGPRPGSRKK